jgi:peptidoglycan/xylan/chitin deacetylase (PgdA/CDA1 family)
MKTLLKYLFAGFLYYSGLLYLYLFLRDHIFGREKVRILLYHRILDLQKERSPCSLPGVIVSVKMFDQQMRYLSKNYHVISMESLVDRKKSNLPFPKKGVVITFDDGWKDNYSYAFPILKRYHLPTTIFLTSGYIGTNKTFWPEQVISIIESGKNLKEKLKNLSHEIYPPVIQDCLNDLLQEQEITSSPPHPNPLPQRERGLHKFPSPMGGGKGEDDTLQYKKPYWNILTELIEHLKYLPKVKREVIIDDLKKRIKPSRELFSDRSSMLNWEEIEILEKNHISFGSHSISHRILTQLDKTEARKEIFDSKKEIEKNLDKPVLAFAYPNGDLNDSVRKLVKEAGYLCAVTLGSGLNDKHADLFSLSRRNIHESSSAGPPGKFSKALFVCQINGVLDLL